MIVEIQCLPAPPGTAERRYAHVEAAIARIQQSGLHFEVGALGTTLEGDPDLVWPLLRDVHEACLRSGAETAVTVIKIAERAPASDHVSMQSLTANYRDR